MADGGIFSKYWGTQDTDLYGGRVAGRSGDGFPVMGAAAPHLRQDEFDALPLVSNFHAQWFRMWVPEDLEKYHRVMDHVCNNEFFIKGRYDVAVPDHPADEPGGSLKVWLEWVQVEARVAGRPDAIATLAMDTPPPFEAVFPFKPFAGGE